MSYAAAIEEFPDWDTAYAPIIPSSWQETSWHNDTCPSWRAFPHEMPEIIEHWASIPILVVFVDFYDQSKREITDCEERFSARWDIGLGRKCTEVYAGNDWDELLRLVAVEIALAKEIKP